MARIGFVGLGNMGGPMARNLLKAGHQVAGYDLVAGRARRRSPPPAGRRRQRRRGRHRRRVRHHHAARRPHVRDAWLGAGGMAAAATPAAHPDRLLDHRCRHRARRSPPAAGRPMLDAPVSGGTMGAEAGTLTFMVGGAGGAFASAQPILAAMGRTIVHCGAAGRRPGGQGLQQHDAGRQHDRASEALVLAEKLGLSHQALFDVASKSSGQSWAMTTYCPVPGLVPDQPGQPRLQAGLRRRADAEGPAAGQEAAASAGAATPLGAQALALFERFVAEGGGETDFSGIIRMLGAAEERAASIQPKWALRHVASGR